ncbi:MAG: DUF4351 domain-containing protein [Blastocatellia bacterium]
MLKHEGLLPLATLCRAGSGEQLLMEVAARINRIKSRQRRRETLNWSRMMAGLRYNKNLIYQIFKESDMLEESVVYQDILQKGEEKEARKLAMLQLERKFGKPALDVRRQIERLLLEQVEALCIALLDLKTKKDLANWLKQHAQAG